MLAVRGRAGEVRGAMRDATWICSVLVGPRVRVRAAFVLQGPCAKSVTKVVSRRHINYDWKVNSTDLRNAKHENTNRIKLFQSMG
jgi:hypothetical protein